MRIGISASFLANNSNKEIFNGRALYYLEASLPAYLQNSDATVFMIPPFIKLGASYQKLIANLDGLVLQGGVDINPKAYGEEAYKVEWSGDCKRDAFELALINEALLQNKPILGICRGHQLINVAMGGSLYQDILTFYEGAIIHRDADLYDELAHEIVILEGSYLAKIYGTIKGFWVNSVHHQGIKALGKGLIIQALAKPDNLIEAVILERKKESDPFCLGVQWHPEFQTAASKNQLDSILLLNQFIKEIQIRLGA